MVKDPCTRFVDKAKLYLEEQGVDLDVAADDGASSSVSDNESVDSENATGSDKSSSSKHSDTERFGQKRTLTHSNKNTNTN